MVKMNKITKSTFKHVGHLIDLWLPLKIKYDKTPGLSVGIVYKDKLIYSNGFGYAEMEKEKEKWIAENKARFDAA